MMTAKEKAEKAAYLRTSGQCNCCQAVAAVLGDEKDEKIRQLCSGFAAGGGTAECTCGALIAAIMMAGISTNGKGTLKKSRLITSLFKEKCGALICRDLKGLETGEMLCSCEDCVRNAVLAYEEAFKE